MTQALVVDLLDPELFSSNRFWDVFAWLRANDPVHWHHEPNGPGFWTVTRYRDVTAVYAGHESFSSRQACASAAAPTRCRRWHSEC
jgi:cytochrome P450